MQKKYFYSLILLGILLDLGSKQFALQYFQEPWSIIGTFLQFAYVENDGIAFSIDIPFLKIATIILIIGIFVYYYKEERTKKNMYVDMAFALVLAGAVGNGIERIFQNYVIDFIAVQGFSVFNIADSFITIGAIIYIVYLFLDKKMKKNIS
ncbi:signal peptidase II [Candidatus Gracilibacteria bacterium]|nr:signal peptidase II [Candidatus Gracilibacteria bacterium]